MGSLSFIHSDVIVSTARFPQEPCLHLLRIHIHFVSGDHIFVESLLMLWLLLSVYEPCRKGVEIVGQWSAVIEVLLYHLVRFFVVGPHRVLERDQVVFLDDFLSGSHLEQFLSRLLGYTRSLDFYVIAANFQRLRRGVRVLERGATWLVLV